MAQKDEWLANSWTRRRHGSSGIMWGFARFVIGKGLTKYIVHNLKFSLNSTSTKPYFAIRRNSKSSSYEILTFRMVSLITCRLPPVFVYSNYIVVQFHKQLLRGKLLTFLGVRTPSSRSRCRRAAYLSSTSENSFSLITSPARRYEED